MELMLKPVRGLTSDNKEHIIDTSFFIKVLLKPSLYNILKNVMFHSKICKKKNPLYVINGT